MAPHQFGVRQLPQRGQRRGAAVPREGVADRHHAATPGSARVVADQGRGCRSPVGGARRARHTAGGRRRRPWTIAAAQDPGPARPSCAAPSQPQLRWHVEVMMTLRDGAALSGSGGESGCGMGSALVPHLILARCGVLAVRKRFALGNGDAQEHAQWHPSLPNGNDQQPLRGDRRPHRLIVLGTDGLAMRPIGEPTTNGAGGDDILRHRGSFVVSHGDNGGLNAGDPARWVADGADDCGVWVRRGRLAREVCSRPGNNGLKASQQRPPVERAGALVGFARLRLPERSSHALVMEEENAACASSCTVNCIRFSNDGVCPGNGVVAHDGVRCKVLRCGERWPRPSRCAGPVSPETARWTEENGSSARRGSGTLVPQNPHQTVERKNVTRTP